MLQELWIPGVELKSIELIPRPREIDLGLLWLGLLDFLVLTEQGIHQIWGDARVRLRRRTRPRNTY